MAERHRITVRGEQRHWASHATRSAQVVDLEPGPADRVPSRPQRSTGRRGGWGPVALSGIGALLVLAVVGVLLDGDGVEPTAVDEAAVEPEVVAGPDFGAGRELGPTRIATEAVVAEPYRGTVRRYWPPTAAQRSPEVHSWLLDDLGAWAEEPPAVRRVLIVVDPTRRAGVEGTGNSTLDGPDGDIAVRRMPDPVAGVVLWEWDRPGWGFSMLTAGLGDGEAIRLAAGVVDLPAEPSLTTTQVPTLSMDALDDADLEMRWNRRTPSVTMGAPLVGQGGLDAVEGYLYSPDPVAPQGAVLLAVTRHRAVTAADLSALAGPRAHVGGGVGFEFDVGETVGRRITGRSRLVVDTGATGDGLGVTVELASDVLTLDELVVVADALDLGRLARLLLVD